MTKNTWTPKFKDWDERPIVMIGGEIQPLSSGKNDIGVSLLNPDEDYDGDGAIFCISKTEFYLRYTWQCWYHIQKDDPVALEKIYKRHSASLTIFKNNDCQTHSVPVYHIKKLPEDLFLKGMEAFMVNITKSDEELVEADEEEYDDDESETDPESIYDWTKYFFKQFKGHHIPELSSEEYDFHTYLCHNALFLVVFFTGKGDWAADEDPFGKDDWPCWYGPDSCRLSPVEKANRLDARFRADVTGDYITRKVVVLADGCDLLNATIQDKWEEANVDVIRIRPNEKDYLLTLESYLEHDTAFVDNREIRDVDESAFVNTVNNFDLWYQEGK